MIKLNLAMPQPGETITEGMIIKWLAKEGDAMTEGTPIAELETEKAVFEYESPFVGKLVKILYPAETRVNVGKPIAIIEVDAKKAEHYLMLGIATVADGGAPVPVGANNDSPQNQAPIVQGESLFAPTNQNAIDITNIKMSPYVRHVACENDVSANDLAMLASADPEKRVTKEAILAFLNRGSAPCIVPQSPSVRQSASTSAAAPLTGGDGYRTLPFSPIRLRIAENMALSKKYIPHAHTGLTVDMTNVLKFREANKDAFKQKHGVGLSLLTLMMPALVKAVQVCPGVNASFVGEGDKAEIRLFNAIHLGVAVGTDNGLMTPSIKNVQALAPADFAKKMLDVIDRASRKKLMPADFAGTTFLFNNFGYFGLNSGVQVIQYPLSATLGMGCLEKKVVPYGEGIAVRDTANFFLAFDHRVIDGLEAGNFLTSLKNSLENFTFEV